MIDFADRSDSQSSDRRERLLDVSPSAKLVYKMLELESPLTSGQLAERTRLPARTVRHALSTLDSEDLVEARISLQDARKRLYAAKPVAKPEDREP